MRNQDYPAPSADLTVNEIPDTLVGGEIAFRSWLSQYELSEAGKMIAADGWLEAQQRLAVRRYVKPWSDKQNVSFASAAREALSIRHLGVQFGFFDKGGVANALQRCGVSFSERGWIKNRPNLTKLMKGQECARVYRASAIRKRKRIKEREHAIEAAEQARIARQERSRQKAAAHSAAVEARKVARRAMRAAKAAAIKSRKEHREYLAILKRLASEQLKSGRLKNREERRTVKELRALARAERHNAALKKRADAEAKRLARAEQQRDYEEALARKRGIKIQNAAYVGLFNKTFRKVSKGWTDHNVTMFRELVSQGTSLQECGTILKKKVKDLEAMSQKLGLRGYTDSSIGVLRRD